MHIDPAALTEFEGYRLLVGIIAPRPIAWVTSLSPGGVVNAAPFSCFTWVSHKPLMVAIVCGRKHGVAKDTALNAQHHGEFVVNVVAEDLAGAMNVTAAEFPPEVSEVDAAGLRLLPGVTGRTPRIADSPVHLECHLHQVLEFGNDRTQVMIGEIRSIDVRDDLYDDGRVDTLALRPLGRLGGAQYCLVRQVLTMERPTYPEIILERRRAVDDQIPSRQNRGEPI